MELKFGSVVYSKSGRDAGTLLAVVGSDKERVLLSDGKHRPLERPKAKNKRHIGLTKAVLSAEEMATDRSLKRALAKLAGENENC